MKEDAMRKSPTLLLAASLAGMLLATANGYAQEQQKPVEPTGQELAFNNTKGNCLACHMIPGDPKAVTNTNIAPPLVGMKARFPDKAKLRAQIWDATKANPMTVMPPFGRNLILTEQEIDKITDYVYGM
jgi:sulfur-oxidizing protein SoxX